MSGHPLAKSITMLENSINNNTTYVRTVPVLRNGSRCLRRLLDLIGERSRCAGCVLTTLLESAHDEVCDEASVFLLRLAEERESTTVDLQCTAAQVQLHARHASRFSPG